MPGGGKALLHCSTQLDDAFAKCDNMDQRIGVEIVQRALKVQAMPALFVQAGYHQS